MPGGKIAEIRARDWEKHGENQILASFGQNHLKFNVHYIISWLAAAEAEKLAEKQFPFSLPSHSLALSLSLSLSLSFLLYLTYYFFHALDVFHSQTQFTHILLSLSHSHSHSHSHISSHSLFLYSPFSPIFSALSLSLSLSICHSLCFISLKPKNTLKNTFGIIFFLSPYLVDFADFSLSL